MFAADEGVGPLVDVDGLAVGVFEKMDEAALAVDVRTGGGDGPNACFGLECASS